MQVWALAVGKKTEMLATGGSDAVVNLWHDSTASDKEEAFRKEVSNLPHSFNALKSSDGNKIVLYDDTKFSSELESFVLVVRSLHVKMGFSEGPYLYI